METLREGQGRLFSDPDPDALRAHSASRDKGLFNKLTTVSAAVERWIPDGTYIAMGGFGQTRIATALLHELVRRGRKRLGVSGHTATHDFQILSAGRCFDRCDVAYVIGMEMRGMSPFARKYLESGAVELTEWTNAALLWRYRAAAMGVSFLPSRSMLGTDTFAWSGAKEVRCPFTGKIFAALPALAPDVALLHVHRADIYGNCQIDGSTVADIDLAMAAKRVVVTCERLMPNAEVRRRPDRTVIPYYLVDAVIEVPYGSFPGDMPYEYFSDERHLRQWLDLEEKPAEFEAFIDRHIRQTKDFNEYLALCGGLERLRLLRQEELLIDREARSHVPAHSPAGHGPAAGGAT